MHNKQQQTAKWKQSENRIRVRAGGSSSSFNGETSFRFNVAKAPHVVRIKLFSTFSARPLRRSTFRWFCFYSKTRWKLHRTEMRLLFSSNCFLLVENGKVWFSVLREFRVAFSTSTRRWKEELLLLTCLKHSAATSSHPNGKFWGAYNVMQIFIPKLNKIHSFNFIDFASHWTGFCCDIKSLSSTFCRREEFVFKEIRLVETTRFYERILLGNSENHISWRQSRSQISSI